MGFLFSFGQRLGSPLQCIIDGAGARAQKAAQLLRLRQPASCAVDPIPFPVDRDSFPLVALVASVADHISILAGVFEVFLA
jgi:hypothetical protein